MEHETAPTEEVELPPSGRFQAASRADPEAPRSRLRALRATQVARRSVLPPPPNSRTFLKSDVESVRSADGSTGEPLRDTQSGGGGNHESR